MIDRQKKNRIEQKTQHSKCSTSIMFCSNVIDGFIPPMIIYQSENLYKNWVTGGQKRYNLRH